MYLLSLFLLFMLAGWILATSRFSQTVDNAAGSVAARISRLGNELRRRWQALFRRGPRSRPVQGDDFRQYALGIGAALFPPDLKTWLAGLTEEETRSFQHSLGEYAQSLGFSLRELVDGSLDRDPIMRQVFVEAIVVYSPAYRKARQAKKDAAAEAENNNGAHTADPNAPGDKQPAQKSPSRRKQPAAEETESAAATS
jgi:hypothetical protein